MMNQHSPQPTEAQMKARTRNWLIKRLRNAYYTLAAAKSRKGMQAVDEALERLGAEPETDRIIKRLGIDIEVKNLLNQKSEPKERQNYDNT